MIPAFPPDATNGRVKLTWAQIAYGIILLLSIALGVGKVSERLSAVELEVSEMKTQLAQATDRGYTRSEVDLMLGDLRHRVDLLETSNAPRSAGR
jgi:hypothetical protein